MTYAYVISLLRKHRGKSSTMREQEQTMAAQKTLARIAGLLYLLTAVATVIAGSARGFLVVPGDAATTAAHIQGSAGLFQVGILADRVLPTTGVRGPAGGAPAGR
jgi:hypothetical protein